MKNIRRYIHIAGVLLICCTLLSSCIAEDLSECGSRTRLKVSFMFEAETETGPADTQTHHVTLYAFCEQGYCQLVHEFDIKGFEGETEIDTDLEKGTYDFVAWVNAEKEYFKVPALADYPNTKPQKDACMLLLDVPTSDEVRFRLPRLMHGAAFAFDLTVTDVVRIPLVQNTNYITFTAEGLPATTDTYEFEIRDNNGAYNFDNGFEAWSPFRYISDAAAGNAKSSRTLSAEMTTLRLGTNRTPTFMFRNATTGKTLYPSSSEQETNLVKLIQKAYGGKTVDFDRKHTFDIRLKFDMNLGVTVSIDGWEVNEGDSGLVP
jgi:lipoprotein